MEEASLRILLVEDNKDDYIIVRDMITEDMARNGDALRFDLEWAATYEEGLELLKQNDFNILLVDYNIITHTGLEFMQAAYGSGCTAPVLLLTGQSDYNIDVEAMRAGTADFLDKGGLSAALLERAIRYALERKQTVATLRESEEGFRTLTESMPQIVWMCNPDGWTTYFNHRWMDYTGLSLEESLGDGWIIPFHPDEKALAWNAWKYAVETSGLYEVECRLQKADGSYRWFLMRGVPMRDTEGRILRWFGTCTDIHEIKRAEDAIRLSEAKLEEAQHIAGIGSWEYDFATRKSAWSKELFHLVGLDPAQGEPDYDGNMALYHPEDVARLISYMERAINEGIGYELDLRRATGDGIPPRWYHAIGRPLVNAEGNVVRLVGTLLDITERKLVEEERDRFFTLSLDMLCIAGHDGHFKRLNPAFETTLGYPATELITKPFLDFVHPDDQAATLAEMKKLAEGALILQFVNRYRCHNGSYRWLSWRATPFEDLIYAAAHDVTPLKDAQSALQAANEELEVRVMERTVELEISHQEMSIAKQEAERANQAKSEFLSRMSHELRTPLNAILGFGQILDRQDLSNLQKESIQYILKGGRHLLDLINEVLDIARVEAGHMELSLEPVAVKDIVWEACALMQPLAAAQGIQLDIDVQEADSIHIHVLADRQRLQQVLINLVANAIKYNHDGGRVSVSWCQTENERVRIAVSDTGPGISEEDREKLFTPFERLGAASTDIEGTGLGLVLAQRLVEVMGGTIEVESIVGQGSTFSIELARTPSPEEILRALPENAEANSRVYAGERIYTVLCIEDNLSNLRLLEVILEGRPEITLLPAIQGSVGLDMARQHEPDLILLDLNLPDISGKEVLARLQNSALTREIPVIIISADATSSQIERLLAAGAQAYLTKPLVVAEFLNTIDSILHRGNVP